MKILLGVHWHPQHPAHPRQVHVPEEGQPVQVLHDRHGAVGLAVRGAQQGVQVAQMARVKPVVAACGGKWQPVNRLRQPGVAGQSWCNNVTHAVNAEISSTNCNHVQQCFHAVRQSVNKVQFNHVHHVQSQQCKQECILAWAV